MSDIEQYSQKTGDDPNTVTGPLITFAVLAYNQERLVGEAVQSAFAQTYHPLEIILSDDSSTDGTYERLKQLATAYRGRNYVRVLKTPKNLGLLKHLLYVARSARGEILIVAAGDDISKPGRAQVIAHAFQLDCFAAVFSNFDLIDSNSADITQDASPAGDPEFRKWVGKEADGAFVHGATAAYKRSVLLRLVEPAGPIISEDTIISTYLYLTGETVRHLPISLVRYRRHSEAWSNRDGGEATLNGLRRSEQHRALAAERYVGVCDYLLDNYGLHSRFNTIRAAVIDSRRYAIVRAASGSSRFSVRTTAVFKGRQWRELRYVAPRLFGPIQIHLSRLTLSCFRRWLSSRARSHSVAGLRRYSRDVDHNDGAKF